MLERSGMGSGAADPLAVELGRRGGRIGGRRRAERLSPERRREIARQAARARWRRSEAPPERDANRTRDRIAAIALDEFSRHGVEGARIERIARRARVNRKLIYHYFGSKERLFRTLLDRFLARFAAPEVAGKELASVLAATQELFARQAPWVRLAAWEALRGAPAAIRPDPPREAFWSAAVDGVRAAQAAGRLRAGDPAQLQLTLVAVVMFPFLLPGTTKLITGLAPDDPAFLKARARSLAAFAEWLTDTLAAT